MNGDRRLQINSLVNGDSVGLGNIDQRSESQPNGPAPNDKAPEVYLFVEHGRTYYAYRNACVYPFPCDDTESERLDQIHNCLIDTALDKRLFLADVNLTATHRPQVLDVGHGTGIWVYEMGLRYKNIDVLGIDLYGIQPSRDEAIPNCSFKTPVDFTQDDWGLSEGAFDLIHMSQLCGSVRDWPKQYSLVFKYLRPGIGWLEHWEFDWMPRYDEDEGMPSSLEPLQHWYTCMVEATTRLKGSIAYREDTERLLSRAGFRDIGHRIVRFPLGRQLADARDEKLRRWFRVFMCGDSQRPDDAVPSFEALSMSLFTRQLGWTPAQVSSICHAVRSAYFANRGPLYHNVHIWTARKPAS